MKLTDKDCKHEYEKAIENIKIDNDGLKGFKGINPKKDKKDGFTRTRTSRGTVSKRE